MKLVLPLTRFVNYRSRHSGAVIAVESIAFNKRRSYPFSTEDLFERFLHGARPSARRTGDRNDWVLNRIAGGIGSSGGPNTSH